MKYSIWCTMIFLILLATSTVLAGSIYKWVDKEGKVHYSDRAPDEDRVEGGVETRPAVSGNPAPAASKEEESQPSRPTPDLKNIEVEIYTTSWCRYCRDAKRYFRSRGIAFKEYDVEKDRQAARRLKRYNPRGGVPVTVINGRPIRGYAPAAFARALEES